MTNLPYGNIGAARGVWMGFKVGRDPAKVAFSCPKCGELGRIDPVDVRADGSVSAITTCPKDCGWGHAGVVLERWKPLAS
jgi:hypothetical protein